MKTITIPTNYDPFRLTVNGKEYVYAGGSTVSVPDDVADVIENAIANEPKENPYKSVEGQIADIITALDGKFDKTGGIITGAVSMGGNLNMGNKAINNVANPSYDTSAANRKYVDSKLVVDTETEIP